MFPHCEIILCYRCCYGVHHQHTGDAELKLESGPLYFKLGAGPELKIELTQIVSSKHIDANSSEILVVL